MRTFDTLGKKKAVIGMVHQHFMLIDRFTALENIILGSEPRHGPLLDKQKARQRIHSLMEEYGN